MQWKSGSRGPVKYELAEREAGGWDITSVTLNGMNVMATRRGEFETAAEAEAAAIAKAEAYAREKDLQP